jgi:hypothetical protein
MKGSIMRISPLLASLCLAVPSWGIGQVSFQLSGQTFDPVIGRGVETADFNGDGFTDALVSMETGNRIYFGDGQGSFTDGGARLSDESVTVAGDVDGDGRVDALCGETVWLNDGQGAFSAHADRIVRSETGGLGTARLADLNGDGFPDLFAIIRYSAMRVYFNDGGGRFTDSGQRLGDGTIGTGQLALIALGDVNGDGFTDAVTAGWRWDGSVPCPNRVWLNDGLGNFSESGQMLDEGASHVHGLAMGDLNGDGRPDLVMGIQDAARSGRVYLNDGSGRLVRKANLGGNSGEKVQLADFDGDGDSDVFMPQSSPPNRVWVNDGTGRFTDSGQRLGAYSTWDAAAGDFNRDGKTDVFVPNCILQNYVFSPAPVQVWLNATPTTSVREGAGNHPSPEGVRILKNHPNPFNPATTIHYTLQRPSTVGLTVHNASGEKVRTLEKAMRSAGEHAVVWDAKDDSGREVGSGVYFCRLESDAGIHVNRMALIR